MPTADTSRGSGQLKRAKCVRSVATLERDQSAIEERDQIAKMVANTGKSSSETNALYCWMRVRDQPRKHLEEDSPAEADEWANLGSWLAMFVKDLNIV